ncbi:MAG: carboxypeptidase regulatory-like domain-containing protein [Prevotellaceae bacterium]|nr:carboxypeptidase regulatory-like domain-containing protein [Prevotellaceae bacterium]
MRIKSLLLLFMLTVFAASAQDAGGIKGKVVTRTTRQPVEGAKVSLNTPSSSETLTNSEGVFEFTDISVGTWNITVESPDYTAVTLSVKVAAGITTEINIISLSPEFSANADFTTVEFDMDVDDIGQDLPVTLSASKDVFENIASYDFGILRFRNRGYDNSTAKVYLNGIYMNDAQSGYTPWSLWGGLNEVTRNQESSSAMKISDYGVGSINGITNILTTPSQLRKGFRASVVNASGQYLFRGMVTYASGENDKGWSYALSASTRQGGNFWVNGVDNNSWSYFGSVEKRINNSRLALTFFGAPSIRGVQAASTQEVYDLVNSNFYNANWGYQNGKKRNARVRDNHEPVVMLNYTLDINAKNKLQAGISYRFGRNGYSALEWYDAQDPRPDYYRYLPSYFSENPNPTNNDPVKAAYLEEGWASDWNIRQINWAALYDVNRNSYFDPADGVIPGTTATTRRSKYIVEERRTDQQDLNANVKLTSLLSDNFKLNYGFDYRINQTEYFKVVKDLLGGEYWLDVDQFAERDFGAGDIVQNDLNHPNRIVGEGDKFGYDYYSKLNSQRLWTNLQYNGGQWEAYAALEGGHTIFWREGLFRKGLYPNNSFGKSMAQDFWTYTAKIGATYKISGAHTLWANLALIENAPNFNHSMISPKTRNDFVSGLTTEKVASADLNYSLHLSWIKMRLSGYYTTIKDQVNVINFYDDVNRTFVNFAMSGIDQSHTGLEVGLEIPLVYNITLKSALSYGYYIYTSNPNVTITADNNSKVFSNDVEGETVYWKNYKISGTPQTAFDIGLDYRSRKNLFLGVDLGYYDANYISLNPMRRTDMIVAPLAQQNRYDEIKELTRQEKFPSAFVLNASIGKFWYIGKYMLGMNLDIKNILNNKKIVSGGYEQMRFARDTSNADQIIYSPFDSRYFYLMGTTYYLNVYFRF